MYYGARMILDHNVIMINDERTINLRNKKRRGFFMSIFKKKKSPIKRMKRGFMISHEITEQEYVDEEFESLRQDIKELIEEIDILKTINNKDYFLISSGSGLLYEEVILPDSIEKRSPDACRKWAREQGYYYIKTFEINGELWVKEVKVI